MSYLIFAKSCRGESFHLTVFIADATIDTFYAMFPLIVAGGSATGLESLVGSLRFENW